MKKILFIACVLLSISVIGQSADKGEVEKLRHDVKILQTENTKLKNELRDSVNSLDLSLATLKNLYQNANNEIKIEENSLGVTTSSLSQLNDYTRTKFNRYRGIIKTYIILGVSTGIIFGLALLLLTLTVRKNTNQIEKNFTLQATSIDNNAYKILQKMDTDNEALDTKINELRKIFTNQTLDAKNSCESLVNNTKDQLKKDITYSSQLGFNQLAELKKETSEHFSVLNEKLNIFEKILKDKLNDKG